MEDLIQNIPHGRVLSLTEEVEYETGKVVCKSLTRRPDASLTLLAFDAGEGLSARAAPGDAMAHVLDGEAEVTIDGTVHWVTAGHAIVLPAGVPCALHAITPFKMLLTVIKEV